MEPLLYTDDSVVPVLDLGRGKTKQGRLWVYLKPRRFEKPIVVYDYTATRKQEGPKNWLGDFKGYLQADVYAGYDVLYAQGDVLEVACWANAQRRSIAD